jgi:CRP-like cAMP-binding protein
MQKEIFEILNKLLLELGIKTEFSRNLLIEKTVIKEYPKNKILFSENKGDDSEYILLKGVLHRYNVKHKGDLVTLRFYMAANVITPHLFRTVNNKSIFTLETLTESVIAEIPVKELDNLRNNDQELNSFMLRAVEIEFLNNLNNDIASRSLNAIERLSLMRNHYRNLENLIPHHIIASYLGITNVSLSRLRGEFAR